MALNKIGPNLWQIKVSVRVPGQDNPTKKREQFTGTKTEAEARTVDLIRAIKNSCSLTPQTISTFSEALILFREKRGPFSPTHCRKVDFIDNELGHILLAQLPDRFEQYLRILKSTPVRGKKRSNASTNRHIEIVRAVFGLLVDLEIIVKNPITKFRFPKGEEKARDRYLNDDERLRVINAIREHRPYILPIIQYMLLVPCRKMELVAAKKDQYNPFTATIYIPDSKADIPIYKPVPDEMKDYFNSIPSVCPWLFFRHDVDGYHSVGTMQKPWVYCLKKAGVQNARMHDLRHISATDLYQAGNPERMIMDIAGWKTPMLSTYRHKDSFKSAQNIQFQRPENPAEKQSKNAV